MRNNSLRFPLFPTDTEMKTDCFSLLPACVGEGVGG